MEGLTQITETLYALPVPIDAKGFSVTNNVKGQHFLRYIDDIIHILDIDGEHKIIGTVTQDDINFDCEPYVDFKTSGKVLGNCKLFRMYTTGNWSFFSKNSFRSLLSSKGINPTPKTKLLIIEKV